MDEQLDGRHLRRALWLTLSGAVVGLVVTALVLWSPAVLFGYRSPSLHLVVDSVDSCVALLVAYLLAGRFLRRRRFQDLLLAQGLVLLAVAGTGLSWLTEWLSQHQDGNVDVWLPLTLRLAGALLIISASLVRPERTAPFMSAWWVLLGPMALVAVAFPAMWAFRFELPLALSGALDVGTAQPSLITAHPLFLVVQGAAALCFFVASFAFTVRAAKRPDPLLHWLGAACALAGFARVNYSLFPSLYTDWFYTGDVLRTGFYLLLLVGATREIRQYWDAHSRLAVLEDRRRLARELHDGVIQEIALVRTEGHALPPDLPARGQILTACDRALDEARAAVHALDRGGDETLGVVVRRTVREMSHRYQVRADVDVDDSIQASKDQQHALLRIIREAAANAVHHGSARHLAIRLSREADLRILAIRDDGTGFDVAAATGADAGYGLISMRDRASTLPGSLEIESAPGRGSRVTVTW